MGSQHAHLGIIVVAHRLGDLAIGFSLPFAEFALLVPQIAIIEPTQRLSSSDPVARAGGRLRHIAIERRDQRVLHLHRLEREQLLPLGHRLPRRDFDRNDLAGHGRED